MRDAPGNRSAVEDLGDHVMWKLAMFALAVAIAVIGAVSSAWGFLSDRSDDSVFDGYVPER